MKLNGTSVPSTSDVFLEYKCFNCILRIQVLQLLQMIQVLQLLQMIQVLQVFQMIRVLQVFLEYVAR